MFKNIAAFIDTLQQHPHVSGILRLHWALPNECHLMIFLDEAIPIAQLNLMVADTPVNLHLRTLADWQRATPRHPIDPTFANQGEILCDANGTLATRQIDRQKQWTTPASDTLMRRINHGQWLVTLQDVWQQKPLLASVLLHGAMHALVRDYGIVRGLPNWDESHALDWLQTHDKLFFFQLEDFYTTTDVLSKLQIYEVLREHTFNTPQQMIGYGWETHPDAADTQALWTWLINP